MKKALIISYILIAILLTGLILSFVNIYNQKSQITALERNIFEFNKPKSPEPKISNSNTDDLESEIYSLNRKVSDLEDLVNRVDEMESQIDRLDRDIDQLFRER